MSENMVERLAKAIASSRHLSEDLWPEWAAEARAAIEAMRNPTAEMLYFGTGNKQAIETWNLMIDGALRK